MKGLCVFHRKGFGISERGRQSALWKGPNAQRLESFQRIGEEFAAIEDARQAGRSMKSSAKSFQRSMIPSFREEAMAADIEQKSL